LAGRREPEAINHDHSPLRDYSGVGWIPTGYRPEKDANKMWGLREHSLVYFPER
jgi:hypothetical protein